MLASTGRDTGSLHLPILPGRGFSLTKSTTCKTLHCVYVISCPCGLQYVGRTDDPKKRWANHKSHIRKSRLTCNLAKHCIKVHRDSMVNKLSTTTDIKTQLQFTILESGMPDSLEELEDTWRNRLKTWAPHGLNTREDGPDRLRRGRLQLTIH